jgi:hypothetical protein
MHMDMLAHAVLHATVAAVIGFFVLFAASKADGIVKLVGTILGWWLWIIAVLSIVCVFVYPAMGGKGMGWMHEHMGMHADSMAPATAPAPAESTPAKPDTAAPAAPTPKKP